jgi:hypothetical protein
MMSPTVIGSQQHAEKWISASNRCQPIRSKAAAVLKNMLMGGRYAASAD